MNIDTYRYLMSALIQVFGTIFAVDAIFYIFVYEQTITKLGIVIEKLCANIYSAKHFQRMANEYRDDYPNILRASNEMTLRTGNWVETQANACIEYINNMVQDKENEPGIKKSLGEAREAIEDYLIRYVGLIAKRNRLSRNMLKTMLIPAILSIGFSIELLLADHNNELLNYASYSILAAGFGFFLLMYYAGIALEWEVIGELNKKIN